MPQIAQLAETWSSQVFWLLVFFGITFFVIGRGMVPSVMSTVEDRNKSISDDLVAAKAARDQADREEEAWRKRENENRANAQGVVAKAKSDAAAASEAGLASAQQGIDARLAEAETRIDAARDKAMDEIESVAAEATQDIVARLAGISVSEAEAKRSVKEALAHG